MTEPKLTIGMATYDDFHGVYFTIQDLRLHHSEAMRGVELIVVDNNPTSAHGQQTKKFVENWCHVGTAGARYVAMPTPIGTTAPRQRIFDEAAGEWVMCIDSHVLLWPGSVARLLRYAEENPESGDILHGPLMYDDLRSMSTHFDDVWRGEMWGTWGTDPRGQDIDAEPFEIFAQGLGLFACRKAAWLGFNPHFRGFGGEECYIHEKFRQVGHRATLLPFLRWGHRFARPDGVRYQLTRWGKVRNYVIGHQEIGREPDRVHEHFVASGLMSQTEWDILLSDPIGLERPIMPATGKACGGGRPQTESATLDGLFTWSKSIPRDLDRHADKIREIAADSDHVTAFVKRREWNVFLAAGRPETLIVYQTENDDLLAKVHQAVKDQPDGDRKIATYTTTIGADSLATPAIAQTDLLVIDTIHHADRLWAELSRHGHRVRGRILLRGTATCGEKSEDGKGPGLLPAARRWMRANPEWSVVWHSMDQYGMTLLSRLPKDKPKLPGKLEMVGNLAKAAAVHVVDGLTKVSAEQLDERLTICSACPHRLDDRCSVCGCYLAPKAAMRSSECPIGQWPDATALPEPPRDLPDATPGELTDLSE